MQDIIYEDELSDELHEEWESQNVGHTTRIALVTICITIFAFIGYFVHIEGLNKYLVTGITAFLGFLFATAINNVVAKLGKTVYNLSLLGIIVAGIMAVLGAKQSGIATVYITCEICGYLAIDPDNIEEGCLNCYSDVWEIEEDYEYYASKTQWLAREQRYWFGDNFPNDTIDFYSQENYAYYKKDSFWKPIDTTLIADSILKAAVIASHKHLSDRSEFGYDYYNDVEKDSIDVILSSEYNTCHICGYRAIPSHMELAGCQVCKNPVWEGYAEKAWSNYSKQEWILEQQKNYFGDNFPNDSIEFYGPLEFKGFKRDTRWHPIDRTKAYVPLNF